MQGTWKISNWSRYYIKFQPVPHRGHKCPQFKVLAINVTGTTKDIYSDNTTKHKILYEGKMRNFLRLNQKVQIVTAIFWKVSHRIHVSNVYSGCHLKRFRCFTPRHVIKELRLT
jgi:hypothetical protein